MPFKRRRRKKVIEVTFPQLTTIHVIYTKDVLHYRNTTFRELWPRFPGIVDAPMNGMHCCQYNDYPNMHWLIFEHGSDKLTHVHEVVHLVDRFMEWYGFTETEFRAYMTEDVLLKLWH